MKMEALLALAIAHRWERVIHVDADSQQLQIAVLNSENMDRDLDGFRIGAMVAILSQDDDGFLHKVSQLFGWHGNRRDK